MNDFHHRTRQLVKATREYVKCYGASEDESFSPTELSALANLVAACELLETIASKVYAQDREGYRLISGPEFDAMIRESIEKQCSHVVLLDDSTCDCGKFSN